MKRNIPWIVVAFLLGLLIGQPSISSANSSQSLEYTFCVNKKTGSLRQLLKGSCTTRTENTLTMGAQGPQGVPGIQGEPGVGIPFELVDASGNVVPNVVDVEFYPDLYSGKQLSFTRIIDKTAFLYYFEGNDNMIPELVWENQGTMHGYFLNPTCTNGPYTLDPPRAFVPFQNALERTFWIPGDGWNWSGQRSTDGRTWGKYESTIAVTLPAGERYVLEGGSWVSDGRGNEGYVPPVCRLIDSLSDSQEAWKLIKYDIPATISVDFPVTVRWLN